MPDESPKEYDVAPPQGFIPQAHVDCTDWPADIVSDFVEWARAANRVLEIYLSGSIVLIALRPGFKHKLWLIEVAFNGWDREYGEYPVMAVLGAPVVIPTDWTMGEIDCSRITDWFEAFKDVLSRKCGVIITSCDNQIISITRGGNYDAWYLYSMLSNWASPPTSVTAKFTI